MALNALYYFLVNCQRPIETIFGRPATYQENIPQQNTIRLSIYTVNLNAVENI